MNLTRNRIQSIGWVFVLTLCFGLTLALTLRVNAVKGQVRQTENRIVSLQREIRFLEVEYQARGNQQQLAALNSIEFGYVAPAAAQYIEGERQLASLGMPRAPDAPKPIRMAHAVTETKALPFSQMVSPVTGSAMQAGSKPVAERREGSAEASDEGTADVVGNLIADAKNAAATSRVKLAGVNQD